MAAGRIKSRMDLAGVLSLLVFTPILARLFYLQTIRHEEMAVRADKRATSTLAGVKLRGRIFDRNGTILSESLPTFTCAILKKDAGEKNKNTILSIVSSKLGVERRELDEKWNSAQNYFVVKRKIGPEDYIAVKDAMTAARIIAGVDLSQDFTRYHPSGEMAMDVLGTVNSENSGASGLELFYEQVLGGKTGDQNVLKDGRGNIIYSRTKGADEPPSDIYLTIDAQLQVQTENALRAAVEKSNAEGGMALVQDPRTGEILAMASSPAKPGQPMPLQWIYEPGSTFKMVTIASALEEGDITPDDQFDCTAEGKWAYTPRITINDDHKLGVARVPEIMQYSSNICSAKIAMKMGVRKFYARIRSFGFGTKTLLSYPSEAKGSVRAMEKWLPINLITAGYGHGIAVTAVQLGTAYSALANNGVMMEPQLLRKITGPDGKDIFTAKPVQVRRVLSEKVARQTTDMLIRVVDAGTGMRAQIKGYSIAGKTGTTQKLENGRYVSTKHVASFCGFVPALNPKFTILVAVDHPRNAIYGGEVAAPAFADIAGKLLSLVGVQPDRPLAAPTPDAKTKPVAEPQKGGTQHL